VGRFVGIDLGTTYSVVAYVNANGKPEVIPNEHGRPVTPSVVYLGEEEPVVGDEAKERQALGDIEIASFFKRSMGDLQFLLSFHGHDYSPTNLSALVLAYLKRQAELFFGEPVTDAVITVPAYFNHAQRSATIEAGRMAGLNVLKIISEPTAAALAYGIRPGQQQAEQKVLVYDLGGGTFDISLVSITPTELEVIATDGDSNLGGKDWDDRLINYLEMQFMNEFNSDLVGDDFNELRVQSEQLKRSLSQKRGADIRVQAAGKIGTYSVTRELFEDLTRDLMERTQMLTESVLQAAKLTWADLSGVLPVGGSTYMPMVHEYVKRMSGKPPMGGVNPDEAVGLGAAIQAAMEVQATAAPGQPTMRIAGKKKTTDVIAHSLGLIAESNDRKRYLNKIIICKNQSIPATETKPFTLALRRGGSTELEVFLTQSEDDDPQLCTYLGRYVFSDFPSLSAKEALLNIAYEYDKNGIVHISAIEQSTKQPLTLTVYPVPPDVPERFARSPLDVKAREPLTVYLAFDVSGSMCGSPIAEAQNAARAFVKQCDLSSTSIGLISFSDWVHIDLAATRDSKAIHRAIDTLECGSTGGGNSGDPFDDIYQSLQQVSGMRYAIVLADGVWSHQDVAVQRAKRCHQAKIEVIAIGFGSADRAFLNRIASSSEKSLFTDMSKLTDTFSSIAREISDSGGAKPAWGKLRGKS